MRNALTGMTATTLLTGLSIGLSGGCLQGIDANDDDSALGAGVPVGIGEGFLAGDFGSRRGFVGDATRLEASIDRQHKSSLVHVVREQRGVGAAMVLVSLSGRTLDELEVGEHAFSFDEATLETQSIFVNVCGGDTGAAFDYDAPAARGTLVVDIRDDGARTIDVHTETPRIDPATGKDTDVVETSDVSFTLSR